ncbi:MAG: transcription elongation factor GreA [Deltaproteobacteria bacterium]|nr:transcription elongation factor GreA [Deltaproteobacteria bacterium]
MHKLPIIKQLEDELKEVERELRLEIPKELRKAAAHGDLSENAEYSAAKERQSFLQARFTHLHLRINTLANLKLDSIPKDVVGFGSKVFLEDVNNGSSVVYELVTPEEVDPKNGKISVGSLIGKALFGKMEGDEVSINLPAGTKEYAVLKVLTIHEILG